MPGRPDQGFLAVGRDHGECHRGHRGVVAARTVENVEDLVDRPPRSDLSGSEGLEPRHGGGGVDAVAAHIAHDEDDGGCRLDHVEPIAADVDADVAGEIATGDLEAVRRCIDPGEHCLLQAKGGTSLTLVLGKTGDHRCRPLGNPVEARPIDHVALVGAEVADGDTSDRHAIDPCHRDSNLDGVVGIRRRFGAGADARLERPECRISQGHLDGPVASDSSCADGDRVE